MDISEKTGATQYQRPPKIEVNEIRFSGKDSKFYYLNLLGKEKDKEVEKTEIDIKELNIVFLKIRRKLSYYDKPNKKFISTAEHANKDSQTFLFGFNEKGLASDLREAHESLRTQQVLYILYTPTDKSPEVVRLIVKGASLGSESKADDVTDFYSYLQKFEGKDHVHEFMTKIVPVEEKSDLGSYFCMDFQKGTKLPEEKIAIVEGFITDLHQKTEAQDKYYNSQSEKKISEEEDLPSVQVDDDYPKEDINPEDIPF